MGQRVEEPRTLQPVERDGSVRIHRVSGCVSIRQCSPSSISRGIETDSLPARGQRERSWVGPSRVPGRRRVDMFSFRVQGGVARAILLCDEACGTIHGRRMMRALHVLFAPSRRAPAIYI